MSPWKKLWTFYWKMSEIVLKIMPGIQIFFYSKLICWNFLQSGHQSTKLTTNPKIVLFCFILKVVKKPLPSEQHVKFARSLFHLDKIVGACNKENGTEYNTKLLIRIPNYFFWRRKLMTKEILRCNFFPQFLPQAVFTLPLTDNEHFVVFGCDNVKHCIPICVFHHIILEIGLIVLAKIVVQRLSKFYFQQMWLPQLRKKYGGL